MNKLIYLLLILLVIMTIFTGCQSLESGSDIASKEEAKETVSELGEEIGDVGASIDEIDKGIG